MPRTAERTAMEAAQGHNLSGVLTEAQTQVAKMKLKIAAKKSQSELFVGKSLLLNEWIDEIPDTRNI